MNRRNFLGTLLTTAIHIATRRKPTKKRRGTFPLEFSKGNYGKKKIFLPLIKNDR